MDNTLTIQAPNGDIGTIPADKWEQAQKDGMTLAGDKPIDIISPNGEKGTIPVSMKDQAIKDGMTIVEDQMHAAKVEAEKQNIKNTPFMTETAGHEKDDVLTADGKFKLLAPNKEEINIGSIPELYKRLQEGFVFKDPNARALFDAHLADQTSEGEKSLSGRAAHFIEGSVDAILFGGEQALMHHRIMSPELPNSARMEMLARNYLGETKYGAEQTAGNIAGIAAAMYATKGAGLVGEGAVAENIAARLGGGILGQAAGGAAIVAPNAIVKAIADKDYAGAAETLALGALTGGGIGLLMKGAGKIVGAGQKLIGAADKEINKLTTAEESFALNPLSVRDAGGNLLNAEEISANAAQEALKKTPISKVEQWGNKLLEDQLGLSIADRAKLGTPAEQHAKLQLLIDHIGEEKFTNLTRSELAEEILKIREDQVGPKIGRVIHDLDLFSKQAKNFQNLPSISNQISALEELKKGLIGPMLEHERKIVDEAIGQVTAFAKKGVPEGVENEFISFKNQQELKNIFQGKTNYRTDVFKSENQLRKDISAIAKAEEDRAVEASLTEFTKTLGKEQLADVTKAWYDMKNLYGFSKSLEKPAQKILNGKPIDLGKMAGGAGKVLAGALIGGAGGGPIGVMVGALGGAGLGADKLIEHLTREKGITKLAMWLRKNQMNPNIGHYATMDAAAILNSKLGDIPKVLRGTAIKSVAMEDPLKRALGDEAVGKTEMQRFNILGQQLSIIKTNPEEHRQEVKKLVAPILAANPLIGSTMEESIHNKYKFLYDNFPKQMTAPKPFSKEEKWEPSKAEMDDFKKILAVAEDPFVVIHKLKDGSLTAKEVAALSAMNPAILSRIREEIAKEAYSGKSELSYQQKLSAAVLMGPQMHESLNRTQQLQGAYAMAAAATGKGAKIKADKLPAAQGTLSQRISGLRNK